MATLLQLDPTAKVYPKVSFDWRTTHITVTEGGAESQPYGRDEMDDFSKRKKLHRALDRACCQENITADKAERLHAWLDRMLDREEDRNQRFIAAHLRGPLKFSEKRW